MKKVISLILTLLILLSVPVTNVGASKKSTLKDIGVESLQFEHSWDGDWDSSKFAVDLTNPNKTYYVYQHLPYRLYYTGLHWEDKLSATVVNPKGKKTVVKSGNQYFFREAGTYTVYIHGTKGTLKFYVKTKKQPMLNYITYGGSKHFIDRTRYNIVKAIGWPQHIYDVKPLTSIYGLDTYLPKDSVYKVYVYDNGEDIMSVLFRDYYVIAIELMSKNPTVSNIACEVPTNKKTAPDMLEFKAREYDFYKDTNLYPQKLNRGITTYYDLFSKIGADYSLNEPTASEYAPKVIGVSIAVGACGISQLVTGEEYFNETFALMQNRYRSWYGLDKLEVNNELQKAARAHSKEMYDYNYYSHNDKDGHFFSDRLEYIPQQENFSCLGYGENIFMRVHSPLHSLVAFINSIGHRNNVLSSGWNYQGIGFYDGGDKNYLTIDFASFY